MAALKGSEQFVADSLKSYFLKTDQAVEYEEGDDPPDIFLKIGDTKVSVEITDIDQNVLKSRKTIDRGYLRFLDNLDREFGHLLEDQKKLLIFFFHNYVKVSSINKKFENILKSIIETKEYKKTETFEGNIEDVGYKISTVELPPEGKIKIAGGVIPHGGKGKKPRAINVVCERISDTDLMGQTLSIIQNRIGDKSPKCEGIKKPIWLALCDNYYNKFTDFKSTEHIDHYKSVFENIDNFGSFEKILIIFENGDVCEFNP